MATRMSTFEVEASLASLMFSRRSEQLYSEKCKMTIAAHNGIVFYDLQMRLLLIRHGETVDNVAGVYAGVKDSPLTIQGNLQAERLGKFLAERDVHLSHVFSSDLQRAVKTAIALCTAQLVVQNGSQETAPAPRRPEVTQLEVLREQDFGYYEGKSFHARPREGTKSGKDEHRSQHQDDPDFQDVESKESMNARMDTFLLEHLLPILEHIRDGQTQDIAIVSHGIILSHLWRRFLNMCPKYSVSVMPGLSLGYGPYTALEHLGGWSNTGYLELIVLPKDYRKKEERTAPLEHRSQSPTAEPEAPLPQLSGYSILINVINSKEHLVGLKRVRGVGSSQHDEGQKKIENFFKKPKT